MTKSSKGVDEQELRRDDGIRSLDDCVAGALRKHHEETDPEAQMLEPTKNQGKDDSETKLCTVFEVIEPSHDKGETANVESLKDGDSTGIDQVDSPVVAGSSLNVGNHTRLSLPGAFRILGIDGPNEDDADNDNLDSDSSSEEGAYELSDAVPAFTREVEVQILSSLVLQKEKQTNCRNRVVVVVAFICIVVGAVIVGLAIGNARSSSAVSIPVTSPTPTMSLQQSLIPAWNELESSLEGRNTTLLFALPNHVVVGNFDATSRWGFVVVFVLETEEQIGQRVEGIGYGEEAGLSRDGGTLLVRAATIDSSILAL